MKLEEKLKLIAETLDAELSAIKPDSALKSIEEWDSMGTIALITMFDRKFSKILSAEQLAELRTIQDILSLMPDEE